MKRSAIRLAQNTGIWDAFECHENNDTDIDLLTRFYMAARIEAMRDVADALTECGSFNESTLVLSIADRESANG